MIEPLDPENLTGSASINRVVLADLPGLPAEYKGKRAYDLFSSAALIQMIRDCAGVLGFAAKDVAETTPALRELPRTFDHCFESPEPAVRTAAEAIGAEMGRRLGYILLALARGDTANRAARAEWDDSYWTYWSRIRRVWLGGGLASSHLGQRIRLHAQHILNGAGFPDYEIRISPFGSSLPLVGAARRAPMGTHSALIFDFGQTFVKRAVAQFEDGALTALKTLEQIPSGCSVDPNLPDDPALARNVAASMMTTIEKTSVEAQARGIPPGEDILCSLACYIVRGQPFDRGCYGVLRLLSDNLETYLAQQIGQRLGRAVRVRLLHDGTAAATAYAGEAQTAVLMLGTAIGIGFPPLRQPVLPLAPLFQCAGGNQTKSPDFQ